MDLWVTGGFIAVVVVAWLARLALEKRQREARLRLHAALKQRECSRLPKENDCFVLFAVGTRGDVQPMIALGLELLKRRFRVCVCTLDQFKEMVETHGLEFASCGLSNLADQEAGWLLAQSEAEFLSIVASRFLPKLETIGEALYSACKDRKPLCIITGMYGLHIALDVAESCRCKIRAVKYMPDAMTADFPPFGRDPPMFAWMNKWLHWRRVFRMVFAAQRYGLTKAQNKFRREKLGLPPLNAERLESSGKYLPTMYAYSPTLSPKPVDWAPWHGVFGFFFTPSAPRSALSSNVERFLADSESLPVVVITFGSMNSLRSAGCDVVVNATRAALSLGMRVIVITGWTELDTQVLGDRSSNNLLVVQSAPHELLFPHCSLVIHHGGAGTTARAVEAGVPSIIIPVLKWYDQRGWAMAVEAFGAAIRVDDPFVSEQKLKELISRVVSDSETRDAFKRDADHLAIKVREEKDAVVKAVDFLLSPLSATLEESSVAQFSPLAMERMINRSCLSS